MIAWIFVDGVMPLLSGNNLGNNPGNNFGNNRGNNHGNKHGNKHDSKHGNNRTQRSLRKKGNATRKF